MSSGIKQQANRTTLRQDRMVREYRRNLLTTLTAVFIITIIFCYSSVRNRSAQTNKVRTVVVIVEIEALREQPNKDSSPLRIVSKGVKLRVLPATGHPGWYFGNEIGTTFYGYIHGNSIGTSAQLTKQTANKKHPAVTSAKVQAPKYIILDVGPEPPEAAKTAKPKPTTFKNQCQPPIFCPDIGDIDNTFNESEEKFSKGKFEKTIEWEKRMENVLSSIKLGETHTASEKMYFPYEQGTGELTSAEAVYDADKEIWTFPVNFFQFGDNTCLPLSSGATGGLYCLVVLQRLGSISNIYVPMTTQIAAANNEKLQLTFVGKIVRPFRWSSTKEVRGINQGIYFDLEEIICLNPKSGQRWKVAYKEDNSRQILQ